MGQSLTNAHHRVYRSYWQDGALDLIGGLAFVCIGVAWVTGHYLVGTLAPVLAVPIWSAFRKKNDRTTHGKRPFR